MSKMEREQITELRIGNYVSITPHGKDDILQLDISSFESLLMFKNFERIKPILLTEEWLVKGGCEKVNNSTYRKGTFTFQAVNMSENYQKEDVIDRIFNSKKGFRVCMQGKFVRNIFWVHDWQNFHFGISKQELIFSNE